MPQPETDAVNESVESQDQAAGQDSVEERTVSLQADAGNGEAAGDTGDETDEGALSSDNQTEQSTDREEQLAEARAAHQAPELDDDFEIVRTGRFLDDSKDIMIGDTVIAKYDDGVLGNSGKLEDELSNVETIDGAERGQVPDGQGGTVDVIKLDNGTILLKSGDSYVAITKGRSGEVHEGDKARQMYETAMARFNNDGIKDGGDTVFQADGESAVTGTQSIRDKNVVINGADGKPLVKLDDADGILNLQRARLMVDLPEGARQAVIEGVGVWSQIQDADGGTTEVIQTEDGKVFVKKGDEYFALSKNEMKTGGDARLAFETQAGKFLVGRAEAHQVAGNPDIRMTIGYSDNRTAGGTFELVSIAADGTVTTNIPEQGSQRITNQDGTLALLDNGTQLIKSTDGRTTIRNADGTVIRVSQNGSVETIAAGAEASDAWESVFQSFKTNIRPVGDDGIHDNESWNLNPLDWGKNAVEQVVRNYDYVIEAGADAVGLGDEYDAISNTITDWWYDDFDYDTTYTNIVEASKSSGAREISYDFDIDDMDLMFDEGGLESDKSGNILQQNEGDKTYYLNKQTGDMSLVESGEPTQVFREDGTIITKLNDGQFIVQHPDQNRTVTVSDGDGGTGRIVEDGDGTLFKVKKGELSDEVRVNRDGGITDRLGIQVGRDGSVTIPVEGDIRSINVIKGDRAAAIREALTKPGEGVYTEDGDYAHKDDIGVYSEGVEENEAGEMIRTLHSGATHPETGEEIVFEMRLIDGSEVAFLRGANKSITEMTLAELSKYGISRREAGDNRFYFEMANGRQFIHRICQATGNNIFNALRQTHTPDYAAGEQGPPMLQEVETSAPDEQGRSVMEEKGVRIVTRGHEGEGADISLPTGETLEMNPNGTRKLLGENGEELYTFNFITGEYESEILSFDADDPRGTAEFFGGSVKMSDAYGYGGGGYHYDSGEAQASGVGAAMSTVVAGTSEANRIKGLADTVTGSDITRGSGVAGAMLSAAGQMYAQYLQTGDMQALIAFNRIMDARQELIGTLKTNSRSAEVQDELRVGTGMIGGGNSQISARLFERYNINAREFTAGVRLALREDGNLNRLFEHLNHV